MDRGEYFKGNSPNRPKSSSKYGDTDFSSDDANEAPGFAKQSEEVFKYQTQSGVSNSAR